MGVRSPVRDEPAQVLMGRSMFWVGSVCHCGFAAAAVRKTLLSSIT